jgi:hypothetical protein
MLLMAGDDPLRIPSFWQLQTMGWLCLYVLVFVACIPDLSRAPERYVTIQCPWFSCSSAVVFCAPFLDPSCDVRFPGSL